MSWLFTAWLLAAGLLLAPVPAPAAGAAPAAAPVAGCLVCHPGYTSPVPTPPGRTAPTCVFCHQGDGASPAQAQAHAGLVANPSSLSEAPRACGPCHPGWPAKVAASPMATAMGLINQTRYLWGAQPDPGPRFATRAGGNLSLVPTAAQSGQQVDDLLRRRCLRCHLAVPGADLRGARRSDGCAACHRAWPRDGAPRPHRLSKRVTVAQCLACHAGCGAGPEYAGWVPRDDHASARFLSRDPDQPALWQGRTWRAMRPDLHFAAGLACQDCHPRAEIMGDGELRAAGLLHVGVRCTTCHGRPGEPPAGPHPQTTLGEPLPRVSLGPAGALLVTALDGKRHRIPLLATGAAAPVAHRAPGHERVACHACHSATNPADWGLMAWREERPALANWLPLAAQGDPQLLELGRRQAALPPGQAVKPSSRDYLTGQESPGVWVLSPFFRRFEWRLYGRGPEGRTFLLAPRFQFLAPSPPSEGEGAPAAEPPPTMTGRPGLGLTPWHAHTTQRATVGCRDCHGQARNLGLGLTFLPEPAAGKAPDSVRPAPSLWRPAAEGLRLAGDWLRMVDAAGKPQQEFLVPGSGPLPPDTLATLLRPGKSYVRWLLPALEEEWPPCPDAAPGRKGKVDEETPRANATSRPR
ncbi:MAG: hypothetical protein KQJ78_01740 [Deltaproteobacteria bacterium]|nr:hypothetical protein [Deltaproteobacteria bacterium]